MSVAQSGAALPQMPENAPPVLPPPYRVGDGVPWFRAASDVNADFDFSSMAGRYVVLSFLGSLKIEPVASIAREFLTYQNIFDGARLAMALVTIDLRDAQSTATINLPATRLFFDFDRRISRMFGLVPDDSSTNYAPITYILDQRLRVIAAIPVMRPDTHVREVMDIVLKLPGAQERFSAQMQAPVLMIPDVFEKAMCRELIDGYERHGGSDSGFMTEKDGKTVQQMDYKIKRRSDWLIEEDRLVREIRTRMQRRVVPEVLKAFQFHVTRMERYLVARYEASEGGHFAAHRDNTSKGTAHRRFAISINLNSEDYEGGELLFPEFGPACHKPPTGGACVFSCSLLHEAAPVTKGKRYVFLPFLYDEESAKIKDRNAGYVVPAGASVAKRP